VQRDRARRRGSAPTPSARRTARRCRSRGSPGAGSGRRG
jgi:hypothetical protein